MNPLRRLARALDRWATTGIDREVEQALAIGNGHQRPGEAAATRSQPPPAPAPAARETLPPGQAGSATPRAPLPPAPPGPPRVPPPPGLLTGRIAYDIRVWHCGCSLMHIRGRVLGRYRCPAHADLCAWEKEFSE